MSPVKEYEFSILRFQLQLAGMRDILNCINQNLDCGGDKQLWFFNIDCMKTKKDNL